MDNTGKPPEIPRDPNKVKQVIVTRHDLTMRKGKISAQSGHAAFGNYAKRILDSFLNQTPMQLDEEELEWFRDRFTKIGLRVDSEQELMEVYGKAKAAGLRAEVITDSGLTEFAGVPTRTCVSIGPHRAFKIDAITGNLKPL